MTITRRLLVAAAATTLAAAACAPSGISATAAATAPAAGTAERHAGAAMHQHTCDAHAGDDSRRLDHCAAMGLTDPADATAVAASSGPWSDPATWGGSPPTDGAGVHIPTDTIVTIDGDTATLEWIRIDGTLAFATGVDTNLRVDTLVGSPTSTFRMGSPGDPIASSVTARVLITDSGPIDRTRDPLGIGRGVVLHGRTEIQGAEKTPFLELAEPARAGDTVLRFDAAPSGWAIGDRLVIAGTAADATGDETATISSIDGRTVVIDAPLAYDHVGPEADLNVHVANLRRNAVIESEADEIQQRGHLMFMHTSDVEVANAGFYRLGRTDKLTDLTDRIVDQGTASVCVSSAVQENVREDCVLDTPGPHA